MNDMRQNHQQGKEDLIREVESIVAAMRAAVRAALLQHKQAGNPVAEWRDGKVVLVAPEELDLKPLDPAT